MFLESVNQGAFLPGTSSSIQSPICPRCKQPRPESQLEKSNAIPHIFVVDMLNVSCCCPYLHIPSEAQLEGYPFLRRHLSLWNNGQSSTKVDREHENTTRAAGGPWEKSIRAPAAVPFETKNMPAGGESIDLSTGYAGNEELHNVEGGWEYRRSATKGGHFL